MRCTMPVIVLGTLLTIHSHAAADPIESHIDSVGLFKNGLAVVKRTAELSGPGTYEIADVPEPVHGTFWVESNAVIEVQVSTQDVEVPAGSAGGSNLQEELAGRTVTIHFRDAGVPATTGRVMKPPREPMTHSWNRSYQPPRYDYWANNGWNPNSGTNTSAAGRFLILETAEGQIYVDQSMIVSMQVQGAAGTVVRRKPVLTITAAKMKQQPAKVTITYLTKGLAWAPSYRIDLSDSKSLTLQQQAVIRNELGDLHDVEIQLISGFPSVEFARVTSPLSPSTNWANFFTQLNQHLQPDHGISGNVGTQQAVMYNNDPGNGDVDLSATPEGEGVDLHYESIGKRSLAEGASLLLNVASGSAPYDRIVEWTIADVRDADGRPIDPYQRQREIDDDENAVWDSVRFRNPLTFAMTTAPAMIVAGGRFSGQRTSLWTNVGEETTLHITKALSIRTRDSESEVGERTVTSIGRREYRKTTMQGEVAVGNHRKEPVTMVLRKRFSGDLIKADAEPKVIPLAEGVYSTNKRNELTWTLTLQPGEEKTLAYSYSVLVPN